MFITLPSEASADSSYTNNAAFSGPCTILRKCLEAESFEATLESSRDKTAAIAHACSTIGTGRVPEQYVRAVFHCILGLLYTKISVVWTPLLGALVTLSDIDSELYWSLVWLRTQDLVRESFSLTILCFSLCSRKESCFFAANSNRSDLKHVESNKEEEDADTDDEDKEMIGSSHRSWISYLIA